MGSDSPTNRSGPQPPDQERPESICDRFENAWRCGKSPAIEAFLNPARVDLTDGSQQQLIADLVGIDLEWRWRLAGRTSTEYGSTPEAANSTSGEPDSGSELATRPILEHYMGRYPALGTIEELTPDLIAQEYFARARWAERPDHQDYEERFRMQWSALRGMLLDIDAELAANPLGWPPPGRPRPSASTLAYCVATSDGVIRPLLDAREDAELRSVFAIGTRVQDRYILEEELGRGGMGHVYLARDTVLDRLVAIKVVVDPRGGGQDTLEEALAKEARLGAFLNHPAIATVFDFGFHEGRPFTVFEYVEGETLRDVMRRHGRVPLEEVAHIVRSLAEALDFAHGQGIVHRDLKPENIRASRQGPFKILDLGLAKEFRHGGDWSTFAGTPAYSSPEQASGEPSDGRTDQYALALITYEMLAGRRVFEHEDPWSLLRLHREENPQWPSLLDPEIPKRVNDAILRALAKDPNQRFALCRDFADALAPEELRGQISSDPVAPAPVGRINVYICHESADSETACSLAARLEEAGYSTWYYERDTLPGISYLNQCADAIERSESVLLLISSHSLSSPDVGAEIRQAYQANRPFLPILLDLSQAEFQQLQPQWRSALGTAALVDLRNRERKATVDRLVRTLETWSIRRAHRPSPAARGNLLPSDADAVRRIWASDANQIDIRDLGKVVFKNELIDNFLTRRGKCFLSANKGLGKTLLLTYKRYLLSETYRVAKQKKEHLQVCFIPEGRPYLDFMSDVRSLPKTHAQFLFDLTNAKRLWGFALRVSALSHHSSLFTENDARDLAVFPRRIRDWIQGARIEPTVVFKEVLGMSVTEMNRVIDETENYLDHKFRLIHSGTLFFIDKVDQGIRQLSRLGWIHVQAGLIEAAWDAMNANSHTKVYATIRQEAFSNYESDVKGNLHGATTAIQYSEDDLQHLLDQLTSCYEGSRSFKEFVNLNVVKHPHRAFPEDSFQYVRRHTLGRPRDLVIIASELSTNQNELSDPVFRRLVTDTSSAVLVSNVFDEMRVFLDCLHDKRQRLRFFGLLPHNILTRDEAIDVSCCFNNISREAYVYYANEPGQIHHPFCELYRAGLLGIVEREPDRRAAIQRFKQPRDLLSDFELELPESDFYLVHPALNGFIRKYRTSGIYNIFHHVVVGHNQPWEDHFGTLCNVERALSPVSDRELSDSVHNVLQRVSVLVKEGNSPHVRAAVEDMPDWDATQAKLVEGKHDDLHLWLEELLDGK